MLNGYILRLSASDERSAAVFSKGSMNELYVKALHGVFIHIT